MNHFEAGTRELDEFMLRCQDQIRDYGCVVVTLPSNRRRRESALAYTVGLMERFRQPDLVLFGLTQDAALTTIRELLRRYVRPGFGIPLDTPLPSMIDGLKLIVKSADPDRARRYARIAHARCHQIHQPFRVDQLIWPDASGCFPWESGYDRRYDRIQPRLFDLQ